MEYSQHVDRQDRQNRSRIQQCEDFQTEIERSKSEKCGETLCKGKTTVLDTVIKKSARSEKRKQFMLIDFRVRHFWKEEDRKEEEGIRLDRGEGIINKLMHRKTKDDER